MLMRRNVAAGIGSNEQEEYCRAALQRSDRKEPRYKWPTLLLQNAAARLVTGASRRDHITPVLRQLHWLPVKQVDFKLAVLVYKSLHGLAPPYMSDGCQLVTDVGCRHLRSSDVYTCVDPRTQSQIGDRSFSVARPRLWNNLPTEIRRTGTTLGHYRRLLKAFLFV